MSNETFGQRLKRMRNVAQLSQRELAQQANVHYTYISKIEHDKTPPPSYTTIRLMARALIVPVFDLAILGGSQARLLAEMQQLEDQLAQAQAQIGYEQNQKAFWLDQTLIARQDVIRLEAELEEAQKQLEYCKGTARLP